MADHRAQPLLHSNGRRLSGKAVRPAPGFAQRHVRKHPQPREFDLPQMHVQMHSIEGLRSGVSRCG